MCPYCSSSCILFGKSTTGNQRYRCKACKKTHSIQYVYKACKQDVPHNISRFLKEGCGIRSISRLLSIAASTVLRKIIRFAKYIIKPVISKGKEYELDELCTYVSKRTRLIWIVYAIRKDTREVVDFTVGSRSNKTLRRVTDTLMLSEASKVYTDKLKQYTYLIPDNIHSTKYHGTNHIERKNLNLRTHLKRLSRRTICYSKNLQMLSACLRIYFWS